MHAGNIATSKRLQATALALADGDWHSTREIRLQTGSEAVHSDMAALRVNGIDYETRWATGGGVRLHLYRLKRRVAV
jgi:biotin operon repressor